LISIFTCDQPYVEHTHLKRQILDRLLLLMSTYLNMPQPSVSLPIFGSSGQNQGDAAGGWQMDASSGDPMDFDLLAEYLLDDSNENPSGVSFDFK
jgi:hypothetical protein